MTARPDNRADPAGPRLAVVVPYYQRDAAPLAAALDSCFAQSRPPDLVVVVDDGSPSPPEPALDRLPPRERARVTLLRRPNGGPGAARNCGIAAALEAGAQALAFLDSDDAWLPEHLERSLDLLGTAGCSFVTSNWLPEDGPPDAFARYGLFDPTSEPPLAEGPAARWGACRLAGDLVARQLATPLGRLSTLVYDLRRHGGLRFDERLRHSAEDRLFFIELALDGGVGVVVPQPGCRSGRGVNVFAGVRWGDPRQLAIELDRLTVAASLADRSLSPQAQAELERFRRACLRRFWRAWLHQLRRGRLSGAATRRLAALAPGAWRSLPRTLAAAARER